MLIEALNLSVRGSRAEREWLYERWAPKRAKSFSYELYKPTPHDMPRSLQCGGSARVRYFSSKTEGEFKIDRNNLRPRPGPQAEYDTLDIDTPDRTRAKRLEIVLGISHE
jgi:hypothetical protein